MFDEKKKKKLKVSIYNISFLQNVFKNFYDSSRQNAIKKQKIEE